MSLLAAHGGMLPLGAGDPYIASRVSILNLNADLADAKGKVWTANGDAAVSGGWLNLDGTGDYLATAQSTDFDFGSGEFCVEAFINLTAVPGDVVIASKWSAVGGLSWYFGIDSSRRLVLYVRVGSNSYFPVRAGALSLSTDYHVAAYRVGNNWYVAVNGVPSSIMSQAGTMNVTSQPTCIGAQSDGSNPLNGKIRGFRATKGSTGGYGSTSFTPPSFPLPTS